MFSCGGGIWSSVAEAAKHVDGAMVIGVDADQASDTGAERTLTSAMKGLDVTVSAALEAVANGSWESLGGTDQRLGIVSSEPEDNHVRLAPSTRFAAGFSLDDYKALLQAILLGEYVISDSTETMPNTAIAVNVVEEAITYHDFCEMLTQVVEDYGESFLPVWNSVAKKALLSYRQVTRERAMLSIYEAAFAIGIGDESQFDFLQINDKMDATNWGWQFEWNYPEWPNWENTSPFTATNREINYMISALNFMRGRRSLINAEPVFDFDFDDLIGYFRGPVTYREAIDTVRRFRESLIFTKKADSDIAAQINAEANARRDAILNSNTQVTFSGTAYYVSSSTGNNGNDGRSPDTAWQTLIFSLNRQKA